MVTISPAAQQPFTPQEYLIDELLGRGWLVHLLGEHGAGKSLVSTSIAYHTAVGMQWRGRAAHEHPVVYVSPFDGGITRRRLAALATHHELEDLPTHFYLCHDDILADPEGFLDAIKAQGLPCGLIVLDFGHVCGIDWAAMTLLAQLCRKATGAAVILLQEGTTRAQELTPGWDCLWRMERTVNDLAVLEIEHMRDSSTVGRLAFTVTPVNEGAVIVGTSARPVTRPQLTTQLTLIFDAVQSGANHANGYTLAEDEFADIVRQLDLEALRNKSAKVANQQIARWREQLLKKGLIHWRNQHLTINPNWRHVRRHIDLGDGPAERLAETMAESGQM